MMYVRSWGCRVARHGGAGNHFKGGGQLPNSKESASQKKKPSIPRTKSTSQMTKLKSSGWYEGAARSIGISKGKRKDKRS
jgi:hypothetical protein